MQESLAGCKRRCNGVTFKNIASIFGHPMVLSPSHEQAHKQIRKIHVRCLNRLFGALESLRRWSDDVRTDKGQSTALPTQPWNKWWLLQWLKDMLVRTFGTCGGVWVAQACDVCMDFHASQSWSCRRLAVAGLRIRKEIAQDILGAPGATVCHPKVLIVSPTEPAI